MRRMGEYRHAAGAHIATHAMAAAGQSGKGVSPIPRGERLLCKRGDPRRASPFQSNRSNLVGDMVSPQVVVSRNFLRIHPPGYSTRNRAIKLRSIHGATADNMPRS